MGFPYANLDSIDLFNATTQGYDVYEYATRSGWEPLAPAPAVGQAIMLNNGSGTVRTWTRNVSIAP